MALPSWPAGLPTAPVFDGNQHGPNPDAVLASETEVGDGKRRRRSTISKHIFQMTFQLTAAQREAFLSWWDGTVAQGALPFTMTDPYAGGTFEWRFDKKAPWSGRWSSPQVWYLTVKLAKKVMV